MKVKSLLLKFVRVIQDTTDVMGIIGGFAIVAMLGLVFFETMARCAGHGVSWAYEVPALVLIVCISLGLPYTTKTRGHVRLDLISSKLKPRSFGLLETVTSSITLVVSGLLVWQGFVVTKSAIVEGWRTSTTEPVLEWPFLIFLFAGLIFMFLEWSFMIAAAWRRFTERPAGKFEV